MLRTVLASVLTLSATAHVAVAMQVHTDTAAVWKGAVVALTERRPIVLDERMGRAGELVRTAGRDLPKAWIDLLSREQRVTDTCRAARCSTIEPRDYTVLSLSPPIFHTSDSASVAILLTYHFGRLPNCGQASATAYDLTFARSEGRWHLVQKEARDHALYADSVC
jgi:hypothetical protein